VGSDQKLIHKSARAITDRFLEWQADARARPFFAFLNYFDAHAPYLPPDSLIGRFGPPRGGRALDDLSSRAQWTPEEIDRERAAYEASLASIDHQLGRLFDALEARGIADNTIVVVTGDHGEQFGEHGLMDHGNSLYRPLLEVPLVVRFPGSVPAELRVARPVSLRDVASTLADLADVEPAPFPGTSLAALWSQQPTPVSEVFAEVRAGIRTVPWVPLARGRMSSVVIDGFHFIENGDRSVELFDLERDPHELVNLADSSKAAGALQKSRALLRELDDTHRPPQPEARKGR
jgi:arylsulfatase A-like enzyme